MDVKCRFGRFYDLMAHFLFGPKADFWDYYKVRVIHSEMFIYLSLLSLVFCFP